MSDKPVAERLRVKGARRLADMTSECRFREPDEEVRLAIPDMA